MVPSAAPALPSSPCRPLTPLFSADQTASAPQRSQPPLVFLDGTLSSALVCKHLNPYHRGPA